MPDRIALKRLAASDLTFFENLFRTLDVGGQKAITLNADVFVQQLYPALPNLVAVLGDRIPISLTIFGPAAAPAHVISRAITKRAAYKNWRLNGEFIRDPEGEPRRFDILRAGDLAVLQFDGDPGPQQLSMLLIAAESPADAPLHSALSSLVPDGRRSMAQVTRAQIAAAAGMVTPTHPVRWLVGDAELDAAIEDAAQGGILGTTTLRAKSGKPVSAADLAAAKAAAEKNGRDGEALAWIYLQIMRAEGIWTSVEWTSQTNAVSSFDFLATDAAGAEVRIDAKSTSGEFARVIHMSNAELKAAADGARYDLWRIYAISDDGARLRIAHDIGHFAKSIIETLDLPTGITVDSVSIDPATLAWSEEVLIEPLDDSPD